MFDPNSVTLWEGADIICQNSLQIDGIDIPVGTKGIIHSFVGRLVNVQLVDFEGLKYLNQLRGDFIYYWEIAPGCEEPTAATSIIPMILNLHPDEAPKKNGKKYIGYWATHRHLKLCAYAQADILLPWPADYIDLDWDSNERDVIVTYLKNKPFVEYWKGYSYCRLYSDVCNLGMSNLLGTHDQGDGTYIWPEGFAHYVEVHNVKPPAEFIQHVLNAVRCADTMRPESNDLSHGQAQRDLDVAIDADLYKRLR